MHVTPSRVKYVKLRLEAPIFTLHFYLDVDRYLFFRYSDHAFWVPFLRWLLTLGGLRNLFSLPSLIFCLSDSIAINLATNKRAIPDHYRIAPTHPENFLKGFKGYLHTDGYAGYHKLPGSIRVVGCLAHARRKFDEALAGLKEEDRKDSPAMRGVEFFDALFHIEEQIKDLTPEERKQKRNDLSRPVMTKLHDWVFRLNAAPKSLLGKAAHYTREQWQWLIAYLEDGRLEASNNRAERSIKPFVMSRKNFLFANTPSGAKASAIYFSLIETAKENGLDPYRYLTWVLKTAPGLKKQNQFETQLSSLLPLNAPDECRAYGKH